jgi:tetratricopeptide (TPR) repeat protein
MYKGEWQKCIDTLKRHLALPSATWNEERSASMRWIAKSYFQLGNINEAYSWYFRAIAEAPAMRDPYVECAKMAYWLSDWPMCFFMTEEALKIKDKSKTYINMGYSWDHTPHDLCAISCYRLSMYERALEHAGAAIKLSPYDERLKNNLCLIKDRLAPE